MKINKLVIKAESFTAEQIKVMREIKALKREIKEYAKRMAYLDNAINIVKNQNEEYSYELGESWYDYYYARERAKKALKALRDKYHFFL